jgi:hypothetical protein
MDCRKGGEKNSREERHAFIYARGSKAMQGFHSNIEKLTLENENYRKVLYTGKHSQLVMMCLKLSTIYSPAHHKDGIVRTTKEEAEANEAEFEGATTE